MLNMHGGQARHDVSLWFYTDQVDALYEAEIATARGRRPSLGTTDQPGTIVFEQDIEDMFYGARHLGPRPERVRSPAILDSSVLLIGSPASGPDGSIPTDWVSDTGGKRQGSSARCMARRCRTRSYRVRARQSRATMQVPPGEFVPDSDSRELPAVTPVAKSASASPGSRHRTSEGPSEGRPSESALAGYLRCREEPPESHQ